MSWLIRSKSSSVPVLTGLQLQTSSSAVPIGIVYGTAKIAPNIVWTGNFKATPLKAKIPGKGGGSKTSSYDYQAGFILGLCEGPVGGVGTVWNGQTLSDMATLGMTLFTGTTPQAAWGWLASFDATQSRPYGGLAYAAIAKFDLGTSGALPALSFEISGRFAGTSTGVNAYDADPALCVQDLLTNAQYGAGFPAGSIDTASLLGASGDASMQTWCKAAGIAFSPVLNAAETAAQILARWLQICCVAPFWSGGLLKFAPYGDGALTGGGVAYTPVTTVQYALGDDDLVATGGDPVTISRTDPAQRMNWLTIEFLDRSHNYDAIPGNSFDQAGIEQNGLRQASSFTAHEICNSAVAQVVVSLMKQRVLYINQQWQFTLSFEYCLLDPMDLVSLTDPVLGSAIVLRLISMEEDDDTGKINCIAEEVPGTTGTPGSYAVQPATGAISNHGATAAPVNPLIIFEPPVALTGGIAQVWIVLSGGTAGVADPNWGGCTVMISLDGTNYSQAGQVNGPARQGVSTAALAAYGGANPDITNTLALNMAMSAGALPPSTTLEAQSFTTLCLIGAELMAYANSTLTGANAYTLGYLERGLYGTSPVVHAIGTAFARLDGSQFAYTLPLQYVGQTIYLKFQSFNIFGDAVQDISTCTAYTYVPVGPPISPAVTHSVFDTAYSIAVTDQYVYVRSLTATRVMSLPLASAYPIGQVLRIMDSSGSATATIKINVTAAGSDLISGLATQSIAAAYGSIALVGDGATHWTKQ